MHKIHIQQAVSGLPVPKKAQLRLWAITALNQLKTSGEISIRIVDRIEMTQLNFTYRQKNYPTNVLSFPADLPEAIRSAHPLLGDIIVCAEVVNHEAEEQHKPLTAHWAHMIVHGVLHLLGHDHENDEEAIAMESLEIAIMQELGFANPYEAGVNHPHE
jgi:probable rRNA maturation factor